MPTEDEPTAQVYVGVRDPSSVSLAVVMHVSVLPTTTPDEGEMVGVAMVGAVFSTLTLIDEEAEEPSESVAVAVQVTLEPTSVSSDVTV